jgi:hypothetical protein
MTMNERINDLITRLLRTRETVPVDVQPDHDTITTLVLSIRALATALDVPNDIVPSLIDLAYDNIMRDDMPSNDALFYAFLLNVFTLYSFRDDAFDELMTHFSDAAS